MDQTDVIGTGDTWIKPESYGQAGKSWYEDKAFEALVGNLYKEKARKPTVLTVG